MMVNKSNKISSLKGQSVSTYSHTSTQVCAQHVKSQFTDTKLACFKHCTVAWKAASSQLL